MKISTQHTLIDLRDRINTEKEEALLAVRLEYIEAQTKLQDTVKTEQKAIRTAYKEKYAVERLEVIGKEQKVTQQKIGEKQS